MSSQSKPATAPTLAPGMDWSQVVHLPAVGRTYLGSPSLAVLPDGAWVVSHDLFGPGCGNDTTWIHRSLDGGRSWQRCAVLAGQWWSTLFLHQGALYLIGTTREYGDAVIRRSLDGGLTWTTPADGASGLLRQGRYHCAPQPVLVHAGRLWRAMEDLHGEGGWPRGFRSGMMSIPLDADPLRAEAWTWSDFQATDAAWPVRCNGWLEGNAVAGADGQVRIVLRVDVPPGAPELAAVVEVGADGRHTRFDPATGFIPFPGGAKKFTIRRDPLGDGWWTIATDPDCPPERTPCSVRNRLSLAWSPDLRHWQRRAVLIAHPDVECHGFQYVDWLFAGGDLLAACRTAADDGAGGAANNHDANLVTVHRIAGFRRLGV
ncbi:MAG: glycoside hydrolase [Planctomycetes bacterium]|nr:glycoside hydrolase [Planctomycetota bacterium]